ncbi:hypothetical protein PGT21_006333 [Puccinia graminis f. sp. tritici]|uniref:Uncharacterized protein n=1 Tax=Puccinia graminis f. sp. tritici TaxID=56615 RepID=A0A5B0LXW1_PUCGR|nr:hypothetical protein PGT21_006333 [Puccinia graminis f. sp. tritici]
MPAMFVTSIAPAATATVFSILPKHSCKRSGASTCDARPQSAGDPFVSSPTSGRRLLRYPATVFSFGPSDFMPAGSSSKPSAVFNALADWSVLRLIISHSPAVIRFPSIDDKNRPSSSTTTLSYPLRQNLLATLL